MSVLRLASRFSLFRQSACGLALLTCAALAAVPAHAYNDLVVGQGGDQSSYGTVTLSSHGTTASGLYQDYVNNVPAPLDPTLVNYDFLYIYGVSTANVSGGSINGLATVDFSTTNVSGGSINELGTSGLSKAVISGGTIGSLYIGDSSAATVSGGYFPYFFSLENSSNAYISGGDIPFLDTHNTSTANIFGGSVGGLAAFDNSTINLLGTGFKETRITDYYGTPQYSVSGTLQNGDTFDTVYRDYGGQLVFNAPVPVPEASSVVSFGLLLAFGMGGVVIASRKKKAATAA